MPVIHLYIYQVCLCTRVFIYIPSLFIYQSVYLILNSLLDWKPVEKLKQSCYGVSFTFFQYEANSTVLCATKTLDRGSRQARKERTAVAMA